MRLDIFITDLAVILHDLSAYGKSLPQAVAILFTKFLKTDS